MKKRFLNLMALALVVTATLASCKGKEGAADGTAVDTVAVDTTTAPPPPPPADTTAAAPADTTAAAPAK